MWNRDALEQAVDGALSITEILRRLGLAENARRQLLRAAASLGVSLPDGRVLIAQERRRTQVQKLLVKGTIRIRGERLTRSILAAGCIHTFVLNAGSLLSGMVGRWFFR